MSERPEWFMPKRYGMGWTPASWQGWTITIGFVALAIKVVDEFRDRPAVMAIILVPATILFGLVAFRTTRGGWRWRWGEDD